MQQRTAVEHSQSGTMIQMELTILPQIYPKPRPKYRDRSSFRNVVFQYLEFRTTGKVKKPSVKNTYIDFKCV
jgi:hypothetical protein